jgi:hypothetical protein
MLTEGGQSMLVCPYNGSMCYWMERVSVEKGTKKLPADYMLVNVGTSEVERKMKSI